LGSIGPPEAAGVQPPTFGPLANMLDLVKSKAKEAMCVSVLDAAARLLSCGHKAPPDGLR